MQPLDFKEITFDPLRRPFLPTGCHRILITDKFFLPQDSEWVCFQRWKHSMILEWLGLGVISFTQSVAPAGPENIGKKYVSI